MLAAAKDPFFPSAWSVASSTGQMSCNTHTCAHVHDTYPMERDSHGNALHPGKRETRTSACVESSVIAIPRRPQRERGRRRDRYTISCVHVHVIVITGFRNNNKWCI